MYIAVKKYIYVYHIYIIILQQGCKVLMIVEDLGGGQDKKLEILRLFFHPFILFTQTASKNNSLI